ncbi:MAG: type III-A CRISPR-associated RAMP protein Csm3 [Nitrospiraceae bacterium]|nr:type III-A CRISPR-associated RAMP protein Csm3 [Nitrospiraceae bacterium]
MKLNSIITITGKIVLESGLHIGAGDTEMHIGGTDNPVVKHPYTKEPYIPGSSLKGKIRSLLELKSGLMAYTDGSPLGLDTLPSLKEEEKAEAEKILKLFGSSGADREGVTEIGPSRLSFADCPLSRESQERINGTNLPYTEIKAENTIDRIKGTAGNLRFTERVVAGLSFNFRITVKKMEGDKDLEGLLFEGLKLLAMDSLGGSGSRGYGRIRLEFDDEKMQKEFDAARPLT